MPDPVLYVKAMLAAAGASAIFVLALGRFRRPAGARRLSLAVVVGIALGLIAGCAMLQIYPDWPPANALARLVVFVLPVAVVVEVAATFERVPRWLVWGLRLLLAAAVGRIVLHGSVYLDGRSSDWTVSQANTALALSAALLGAEWIVLNWLSRRAAALSIPLALAGASLAAGLAIMLGGYLRGGEAALPLVAAVAGAALGLWATTSQRGLEGAVGISLVGLGGLLFIGRFFGELSTTSALAILLAPLLCIVSELPQIRRRNALVVGVVRLACVALPLAIVLAEAKHEFDKKSAPSAETEQYY